jgi:hypothetical protein
MELLQGLNKRGKMFPAKLAFANEEGKVLYFFNLKDAQIQEFERTEEGIMIKLGFKLLEAGERPSESFSVNF